MLHLSESEKALLERKAPSCSFVYADRKSLIVEMVQQANAIIGNPPLDMVKDLKSGMGTAEQQGPGIYG